MTKIKLNEKAWLVLVFLVVAGVCAWLFWAAGQSGQSGREQVVVDASRLPVTVTVSGVKVTVQSVNRLSSPKGDQVKITVLAEDRGKSRRVVRLGYVATMNGHDVTTTAWGSMPGSSAESNQIDEFAGFLVEQGASRLDFSFAAQSFVPGGTKKVTLQNVAVSSLPATRKSGLDSVTLEQVQRVRVSPGSAPVFILSCLQSGPPDNLDMRVVPSAKGWSTLRLPSEPYWLNGEGILKAADDKKLRDEGGCSIEEITGAIEVFQKEAEHLTWLESLIGKLSRRGAANMITNRAMQAAMASERTFQIRRAIFHDRIPKRLTYEHDVNLPPKDRKTIRVLFKNIPIPP